MQFLQNLNQTGVLLSLRTCKGATILCLLWFKCNSWFEKSLFQTGLPKFRAVERLINLIHFFFVNFSNLISKDKSNNRSCKRVWFSRLFPFPFHPFFFSFILPDMIAPHLVISQDISDIRVQFPTLAEDINIPRFYPDDQFFSSVFRISSPNAQLWTHYDVSTKKFLWNQIHQCPWVISKVTVQVRMANNIIVIFQVLLWLSLL